MSGFDHFLKNIGAISLPEGTSADAGLPTLVKKLSLEINELEQKNDGANIDGLKEARDRIDQARKSLEAGDNEGAFQSSIAAAQYIGVAVRDLKTLEALDTRIASILQP